MEISLQISAEILNLLPVDVVIGGVCPIVIGVCSRHGLPVALVEFPIKELPFQAERALNVLAARCTTPAGVGNRTTTLRHRINNHRGIIFDHQLIAAIR